MSNQDDAAAKARAAAAAAAAVAGATPAQRDRAIQQAVLSMQREREQAAAAKGAEPGGAAAGADAPRGPNAAAPGTYEPPEWGGAPEGVPYALEVLKSGVSMETKDVQSYSHMTFGRSPTADVILEHPSASRLHAVIQFKADDKGAYLYDCGSTHGTFLNKQRVKAQVHIPLRVGDTIKFGQSSRIYILHGPTDLMPEEGLSKAERRQLAMLELAQKQKERDEQVAKAQMAAAINTSGVSWGMGPDAEVEEGADQGQPVDWRRYSEKNPLTDKQSKLVEKIRKREYKIKNMRTECDRISAKEGSEGGLTPGQAAALVRNEKAIDALHEEIEEIEEQLQDSIADSISGKKAKSKTDKAATAKRKRRADSDEDYADADDSEDEFYDRTGAAAGAKRGPGHKRQTGPGGKGGDKAGEAVAVESSESLYGKRAALQEELKKLEEAIEAENKRLQQMEQQRKEQQQLEALEQEVAAAAGDQQQQQEQEQQAGKEGLDTLDAFMTDVNTQMEADKLGLLRKEQETLQQQLARTEKLLRIADPDGWYQPGSAAAADLAKAKAKQALEAERKKRQQAAAAAAEKRKAREKETGAFEPEEEEDEQQQQQKGSGSAAAGGLGNSSSQLPGSSAAEESGGLIQRSKPAAAAAAGGGSKKNGAAAAAAEGGQKQLDPARQRAEEQAKALMKEFSSVHSAAAASKKPVKGPTMPPPKFAAGAAASSPSVQAEAEARVAASLALLTGRARGVSAAEEQEEAGQQGGSRPSKHAGADGAGKQQGGSSAGAGGEEAKDVEWLPPQGQTGDGRTALNEKLGY